MESHVDPQTGIRYLEAIATIKRDLYETFFGRQFQCYCTAWNPKGDARSRSATVEIASKYKVVFLRM